jgi:predicted  nucleic acid-binding Zn-ribbon protein
MNVDRERSSTAKLQKELDQVRRHMAEQADQSRAQVVQLQDELGQIRQKLGGSEAGLAEARAANDQPRAHLDKSLSLPARKAAVKRSK